MWVHCSYSLLESENITLDPQFECHWVVALVVFNMWESFGSCKPFEVFWGFSFEVGWLVFIPFWGFGFLGQYLSIIGSFLDLILIQRKHYVCQMNLLHFLFPLVSSFLICCLVFLSWWLSWCGYMVVGNRVWYGDYEHKRTKGNYGVLGMTKHSNMAAQNKKSRLGQVDMNMQLVLSLKERCNVWNPLKSIYIGFKTLKCHILVKLVMLVWQTWMLCLLWGKKWR